MLNMDSLSSGDQVQRTHNDPLTACSQQLLGEVPEQERVVEGDMAIDSSASGNTKDSFPFIDLPVELQLRVLLRVCCKPRDIVTLSLTCKHINELCASNALWRRVAKTKLALSLSSSDPSSSSSTDASSVSPSPSSETTQATDEGTIEQEQQGRVQSTIIDMSASDSLENATSISRVRKARLPFKSSFDWFLYQKQQSVLSRKGKLKHTHTKKRTLIGVVA